MTVTQSGSRICAANELLDGGRGVRFLVEADGAVVPAFVIRFRGMVYAYLNRCAHKGVELDWVEGQFFDADQALLQCATHGARYDPASGQCVAGPCQGGGLAKLAVQVQGDEVRFIGMF